MDDTSLARGSYVYGLIDQTAGADGENYRVRTGKGARATRMVPRNEIMRLYVINRLFIGVRWEGGSPGVEWDTL